MALGTNASPENEMKNPEPFISNIEKKDTEMLHIKHRQLSDTLGRNT